MIKGLFFILLFYFLGEGLSRLLGGYIPGSVLGMLLLFFALYFRLLKPDYVKAAATVITKNMALFFVPVSVGLMAHAEVLSRSLWAIALAIIVSTILTLVSVALIQEKMGKTPEKGGNDA